MSGVTLIGETADDDPPAHPRRDQPQFLPRMSYGQQSLVPLLASGGARTVVTSLYYSDASRELALVPAAQRLGLVLDPSTHLRELPLGRRSPVFRRHSFGAIAGAFAPDETEISKQELLALATDPVDLQRAGGATLMLSSYHVAGRVGTRGRDLDLMLARAGIAHFRSERMDEPPEHAAVDVRREFYATLAIRVEDLLDRADRRRLASAYLELGADGIWVKLLGFHEAARPEHVRAGAAFLHELADGALPIVSDGAGQLHLAALSAGVSASIGIGDSERFRYPADWRDSSRNRKSSGRVRSAYHPIHMRSFKVNSRHAKLAFEVARCRCGQHPPSEPPSNASAGPHAAVVRMRGARNALDGEVEERREWLIAAVTQATWAAADAGLKPSDGLASFEAFFHGWDGPGEEVSAQAGPP
jgi:hypothetical protein